MFNLYIGIKHRIQTQPLQLHCRRNWRVEYKLNNDWVLFIEILARNLALDNADRYGTSEGLAGHTKKMMYI